MKRAEWVGSDGGVENIKGEEGFEPVPLGRRASRQVAKRNREKRNQ